MKFSTLITALSFALLGSMAVSVSAQTTTVASGCSWTLVSQQSSPSSAIITMACKLMVCQSPHASKDRAPIRLLHAAFNGLH